jgi:glyoxylase-like metal-dependent hydrolase (beta-lactamase superfamily II)
MQFAEGCHRIDTPLGARVSSLYLIEGSEAALLFDTGVAGAVQEHVLPYLAENAIAAEKLRWVVISHCDVDHFGGLLDARESFPNAQVIAHRADADAIGDHAVFESERARQFREPYGLDEDPDALDWMRSVARSDRVDVSLDGEATIDLGDRIVDILHVPGHSRGHLALYDAATDSAIVSDCVLGAAVPFADGRPAFPPTYRYVDEYLATIERLRERDPRLILTAHYGAFEGAAAREFLDASERFVYDLDAVVLRELSGEPLTMGQLVERVNGLIGDWPKKGAEGALLFPVAGHVERHVADGTVTSVADAGIRTFAVAR